MTPDEKYDRDLEQLLAGPIYKSVGAARAGAGAAGATNLALDVALVQSLLNRVAKVPAAKRKNHYDKKPVPTAKGLPAASGTAAKSTPPLPVNGKYDQILAERIKAFQAEFLASKPNGRIDPYGPTWRKLVKVSGVTLTKKDKKEITFGTVPDSLDLALVDRARLKKMTRDHLKRNKKNERMLDFLKLLLADPDVKRTRWLAYYLATVYHETGFTFDAVKEIGEGRGQPYGRPVSVTDTHGYRGPKGKVYRNVYYGRGHIQLTKEDAYKYFPHQVIGLGEDELYIDPDKALDFDISYKILTHWMQNNIWMLKGKKRKLQDHMGTGSLDYEKARAIVNINDRAVRIANYARVFEMLLILSTRR